jgi:hypothetical protein
VARSATDARSRLAAGQILLTLLTLRTLAHANRTRIAAGSSADALAPAALAEADEAFVLLSGGLAPYR